MEGPFWATLILVNCLNIPSLSHVDVIHKGMFALCCWLSCLLSTGYVETMTNGEVVKLLCRSHAWKCLTHGSLIAGFFWRGEASFFVQLCKAKSSHDVDMQC